MSKKKGLPLLLFAIVWLSVALCQGWPTIRHWPTATATATATTITTTTTRATTEGTL